MRKCFITVSALTIVLMLAACGSSTNNNSNRVSPEGAYQGTTSTGRDFQALVLPDGSSYIVYGQNDLNGTLIIQGMLIGRTSWNAVEFLGGGNNTFSSQVEDFVNTSVTSPTQASITGTFVPGSQLSGTVTEGGTTFTFTGTAILAGDFDFSKSPSTDDISGIWDGGLLEGDLATVAVGSDGTFAGETASGCRFTGHARPDVSFTQTAEPVHNFFTVSMNFGGTPCLLPNGTASGAAIRINSGSADRLMAMVSSGTSYGTVFVGVQPTP